MRKNRFFCLLAATMLATAATTVLTACTDDDDVISPVAQSFNYKTVMFGSSDSQRILLDSLTADITDIVGSASWLKATAAPADEGHAIDIVSTKPDTDEAEASIIVTDADGNRATVTVSHRPMGKSDTQSGGNSEWIKEWYLFDTVDLEGITDKQGNSKPQKTPWKSTSAGNIPEEVRVHYKPEQGWEMAFSYLNDPSLQETRYFALYNKWSGQMRVYTYINEPTGWGSDIFFNTYFGSSMDNDMYPLYNVLEYGIPTSHVPGVSLKRNAYLVSSQGQTFQTWLAPYRMNKSINSGWYCFEFDMSGYVPKGRDWLKKDNDGVRFKFYAETATNASISLKGALTGKIEGTFQNEQTIEQGGSNALGGIFNAIGSGLGAIGGMAANSIAGGANYAYLMANGGAEGAGSILNPIKYWGGFACSIAGGLFNVMGALDNIWSEPTTYETIPGKIDLTLDASISLDGYLKTATGNNHMPLSVSSEGIYAANGEQGHLGKGIWSLAEDPIVYIDQEDIISSQNGFNLLCTGNSDKPYSNSSFSGYDARIVYAFDPTSVKLNINTDLFRDIKNVTVTANVGVFPNLTYGNTDAYRKMLMLGESPQFSRPQFSLAEGKTSGTVTLDGRSTPVVTQMGLDDLADGDYETTKNCAIIAQKTQDGTEWQRFHGRLIDVPQIGKKIIVDPQVFIPYSVDGNGNCTGIGAPTSPDFVVRIDVQFTAEVNGQRKGFQFGKLYIPKVKVVGYDEMCNVYDRLKNYAEKCEQNQPINSLANDASIQVRYPGGHRLIGKTLRLLKRVCD